MKSLLFNMVLLISVYKSQTVFANANNLEVLVNELMAIHGGDIVKIEALYPNNEELKNILIKIYQKPQAYFSHQGFPDFLKLLSDNALRTYGVVLGRESTTLSTQDKSFFKNFINSSQKNSDLLQRRLIYSVIRNIDTFEALELLKYGMDKENESALKEQILEHSIQILTDYVPVQQGDQIYSPVSAFNERKSFYHRENENWDKHIKYFSGKAHDWWSGLPSNLQSNKTVLSNLNFYQTSLKSAENKFNNYVNSSKDKIDNPPEQGSGNEVVSVVDKKNEKISRNVASQQTKKLDKGAPPQVEENVLKFVIVALLFLGFILISFYLRKK